MTDSEEAKWYFLNAEKSPVGPYRASDVQALFTGGYVADDTLFWAEGLSEWKPLTTVDELQSVSREGATGPSVSAKPSTAASASAQAAGTGNGSGESAPVDPELAKFQSEIAGIEAGEDPGAGEESPPPDEREFEDDDGTKYAWDATLRKFVPAGGAAGGEPMPEYTIEQMTEPDRPTEVIPTLAEALAQEAAQDEQDQENKEGDGGKRGEGAEKAGAGEAEAETKEAGGKEGGEKEGGEKKRKGKQQQQQHWFELQNNTSVYVQGLPDDATVEEVAAVFKKCGIIKEEEDRRLRIKLYEDKSTGMRKGDGLVTYLKAPSVDLACQILDGTPLRDGLMPMKVEKAKFEMKGDVFKAKKRQKKKKGAAVAEQQERRMLNWGGFDDKIKAEEVTVVLKHMFAPKELEDDSTVLAELEADVRSECGKYGRVDRLNVFKHNPDGVIQVRYTRAEDAEKCIEVMNGRYFAGRRIEAAKWDGVTKHGAVRKDVEEEEAVRLAQYARELESGETAGARTAETPS